MAAGAATARATFELENAVAPLDTDSEALFRYDAPTQRAISDAHPWRENPHYFKQCVRVCEADAACAVRPRPAALLACTATDAAPAPGVLVSVRISALALVKMTMHCRSGGNLEARPAWRAKAAHPPNPRRSLSRALTRA
jgi:COP9 signalosome complex subunit 5